MTSGRTWKFTNIRRSMIPCIVGAMTFIGSLRHFKKHNRFACHPGDALSTEATQDIADATNKSGDAGDGDFHGVPPFHAAHA